MRLFRAVLAVMLVPACAAWAQNSEKAAGGSIYVSQSLSVVEDAATVMLTDQGVVSVQLLGTWVGTNSFEGSLDRGATWAAATCVVAPASGTTTATSATANGKWFCPTAGYAGFRVRFSTATSGTVVVTLKAAGREGIPNLTQAVQGIASGTKVPVSSDSALTFFATVGGAYANDTTASASLGVQTLPGIAKASPTAITADRAQKLQQRTTDGRLFVTDEDGLSNYATATSGLSTATALTQIIAGSGSNKTYILNWKCSASVASTTSTNEQCLLKYGDDASCATNTVTIDGCFQPVNGGCNGGQIVIPASKYVCWMHAVAGSKFVTVTYRQGLP